jgi:hypothetical protein
MVGGYDRWSWSTESGGPLYTVQDGLVLVPRGGQVELVQSNYDLDEFWIFYN